MQNKPIRVLHILQRMEAAGVQTLLMNIYKNIDRNKVQFDFLVHYETPQFFDDEIEKLGGKVYRMSFREDFNIVKYIKDLNNFFKSHPEYKIVHGHMHSLGAIYLGVAKKYNVPVRIAHSHTNCTQRDIKRFFKLFMNKRFAKNATELFACSEEAGKYMFNKKKFTIINNAIDSNRFRFNKQIREEKRNELKLADFIVIGCVGRFEIQKNQKFSIKIFKEFMKIKPKSKLLFIGSGSMEEEIKEIVREDADLTENIEFLGNRHDMPELFQAMDVFLFPSLFEGLGIAGVEAQAAGTPVVCTDTLPKEINVTPLIYRTSLKESEKVWSKEIEKALENKMIHSDMSEYIKKSKYDIKDIAKFLQEFYINKTDKVIY